ncbi:MAG: OmpH family outer membrane protein [Phycisphaerales bacterium]
MTIKTILPALAVAAMAVIAATAPSAAPVIGTVELARALNGLDARAGHEQRMNTVQSSLKDQAEKMREDLRALQDELESFQPGSPNFAEAERKAQEKVGQMRAFEEYAKLKMESESANWIREAYAEMRAIAGRLAQENNIDMIVLDDSSAPVEPGTVQQVLTQLNVRRTLFVNAKLDVTDMLIQRMNAEFKAKQAGS